MVWGKVKEMESVAAVVVVGGGGSWLRGREVWREEGG